MIFLLDDLLFSQAIVLYGDLTFLIGIPLFLELAELGHDSDSCIHVYEYAMEVGKISLYYDLLGRSAGKRLIPLRYRIFLL